MPSTLELTLDELHPKYDEMQLKYGEANLNPIYGAGCIDHPRMCFMFMNPTARNVATDKSWQGLQAPWIGTKSVWKLFHKLDLLDPEIFATTQDFKPEDWDVQFAKKIYENISKNRIFITNLAKCTQSDAKHLPNDIFREYKELTKTEIAKIQPQVVVTFGNQVSSVFLDERVSVSKVRKKAFDVRIGSNNFTTYSVYYPVGQGMRNIDKSISDLKDIMRRHGI
jgi:DNA polymerase